MEDDTSADDEFFGQSGEFDFSKYSRDLSAAFDFSKYSRDLSAAFDFSRYSRDLAAFDFSKYSRDLFAAFDFSKYSRDLAAFDFSKYSRDLFAAFDFNKFSRDLVASTDFSRFSRNLLTSIDFSEALGQAGTSYDALAETIQKIRDSLPESEISEIADLPEGSTPAIEQQDKAIVEALVRVVIEGIAALGVKLDSSDRKSTAALVLALVAILITLADSCGLLPPPPSR